MYTKKNVRYNFLRLEPDVLNSHDKICEISIQQKCGIQVMNIPLTTTLLAGDPSPTLAVFVLAIFVLSGPSPGSGFFCAPPCVCNKNCCSTLPPREGGVVSGGEGGGGGVGSLLNPTSVIGWTRIQHMSDIVRSTRIMIKYL